MSNNQMTSVIYKKLINMTDQTALSSEDFKAAQDWLDSKPSQDSIVEAFVSLASASTDEVLRSRNLRFGQSRPLSDVGHKIAALLSTKINLLDPTVLNKLYFLCPEGSRQSSPTREDKLIFIFGQIEDEDFYPGVPLIQDYFQRREIKIIMACEIISSAMKKALQSHETPSFLMSILDCFKIIVECILGESREKKYKNLADIKRHFDDKKLNAHHPEIEDELLTLARQFDSAARKKRCSFFGVSARSGEVFNQHEYLSDALECFDHLSAM